MGGLRRTRPPLGGDGEGQGENGRDVRWRMLASGRDTEHMARTMTSPGTGVHSFAERMHTGMMHERVGREVPRVS